MAQSYPPPPPGEYPYGQQPVGGYGYGNPVGQPGYGVPGYDYASWIKRVGASLVDGLVMLVGGIPLFVGYGLLFVGAETSTDAYGNPTLHTNNGPLALGLILVGLGLYIAVFVWNVCLKQGRTGYSVGKGVLGIKLVAESTGQPIGPGLSFVRQIAHVLDGLCYIGYLWPLWDGKRQTFADKVMSTVVFNQPRP